MRPRHPVHVPLVPVVVESLGTLLLALGIVILFAPGVLAEALPTGLLTPAVGWAAVAVGGFVSLVGGWQLVSELRRRAAEASRH